MTGTSAATTTIAHQGESRARCRRGNYGKKRSLMMAGILSTSSMFFTVGEVHASSFSHQRTIPVAQRLVPYWAFEMDRRSSSRRHQRQRRPPNGSGAQVDTGDIWHVLGDARAEDADSAFHDVRRKRKNRSTEPINMPLLREPSTTTPNEQERRKSGGLYRLSSKRQSPDKRRRADQSAQEDNLVDESQAREETPGFVQIDTDSSGVEEQLNQTSEFNVTSGTEYNVTQTLDDDTGNTTSDLSTVVFTTSKQMNATEVKTFHPIRIRAFLSEIAGGGEHLTEEERSILLQDIVRPALLAWSAALRVHPVKGNLTVDESQLEDGASCGPGIDSGLPSVLIPSSHITEGLSETDMVLYISLAFVDQNQTNATAFEEADDMASRYPTPSWDRVMSALPTVPSGPEKARQPKKVKTYDTPAPSMYPSSIPDRNVTNVTSSEPRKEGCSGDFLAASSFCSTDQFDRPTAGILHFCVGENFFKPETLEKNIMVVMHELGHVLGFNAVSLAHFRRPDGTAITHRVEGKIPEQEVECTGPTHQRQYANVTLPSEEILQFRSVRGGVRVAEIVTPSVAQVARNHFDCQELPGAELESGEFLPLSTNPGQVSCLGDHFERRLFKTNLMNAVVEGLEFTPRISTMTLAYFADSGWYQVDLSRAAQVAGWGRGAGCAFVEDACISEDGGVPESFENFFCNQAPTIEEEGFASHIHGCTEDLLRKATCSLGHYEGELPTEYQYFQATYGVDVGGSDPFMDYCPVYSGFSNGLCADKQNEAMIRVNRIERFGSRNSRCLVGGLADGLTGEIAVSRTALCLPIACVVEDKSLRIQFGGSWQVCNYKDEVIIARTGDSVTCPDPIRICPTFYCGRDCLGTNLQCDYDVGECVCGDPDNCNVMEGEAPASPLFYDPRVHDNSLPDEDSPLSDYYVPTVRYLKSDDGGVFSQPWTISLLSTACMMVLGLFLWTSYRRLYGANPPSHGDSDDDDNDNDTDNNTSVPARPNSNKDKMIASVVVDMRMNSPDLQDANQDVLMARDSETDLSMTDTEGNGTHVSNLSSCAAANTSMDTDEEDEYSNDQGRGAAEVRQEDDDLSTSTTTSTRSEPACTVRRRVVQSQTNTRPA